MPDYELLFFVLKFYSITEEILYTHQFSYIIKFIITSSLICAMGSKGIELLWKRF